VLDDQNTARAHARATHPALQRALHLVADIGTWQAGLPGQHAPNLQLPAALTSSQYTTTAAQNGGYARGLPSARADYRLRLGSRPGAASSAEYLRRASSGGLVGVCRAGLAAGAW
jgi:hypothetical protein